MTDERLREAYERGLPAGRSQQPLDDVAAERLRRLVEQEGNEDERLHTLDQMLSTREGRQELEIVWAAARAARPRAPAWRRWAVAAAVIFVAGSVGTMLLRPGDGDPEVRSEASPITLVAPLGTRSPAATSRFVWRALPEAQRYTLVIVDTTGNEVFAAETSDTVVSLPDSVRLEAGRDYLWWVQARTATGVSVTAVTQRLKVTR